MIKYFSKHKYLVAFILIIALFIPYSIYQVPETDKISVITSIGLDKIDKGIQLSVNSIMPNSGTMGGGGGSDGTVKSMVINGKNVGDAFTRLALVLGKLPGLAHCDSIVLNKELFEEDVTEYLDYFVRTNNLTSNASLIVAEESAKEIIETAASQKGLRAITLSDVLLLNHEYVLAKKSNIEAFYANYFSNSSSMALPILSVGQSNEGEEDLGDNEDKQSGTGDQNNSQSNDSSSSQDSGGNSSDSQSSGQGGGESSKSGGQSGSSGSTPPTKILKNEGKGLVVKKGKAIKIIEGEDMDGLSLLSKTTKKGHIQVDNVNSDEFNDATLNFDIFQKRVTTNGYFLGDTPVFNYDILLILRLEEVVMDSYDITSMVAVKNFVKGNIKDVTQETIYSTLAHIINTCKNNQTDILGVYDYFFKYHTQQWKDFLDGLDNKEDYLKYVVFTCELTTQGKI